jgi:hypothetical protein
MEERMTNEAAGFPAFQPSTHPFFHRSSSPMKTKLTSTLLAGVFALLAFAPASLRSADQPPQPVPGTRITEASGWRVSLWFLLPAEN